MSLFVIILAISTLTISVNSMAFNGETPSIEVKGQASVLAEPDRFSLTIAIVERGRLRDKVRSVVDYKSNQVIQVAENLGIKNHDINSARVTLIVVEEKPSITVDVGVNATKNQPKIKPQLFELRRTININFLSIDDYDQFLNKAIKLGVSHIYPLAMSVENTEKHYQQALVLAIKNAKNKATKIASHANVILGKLLFVKEQSSNYYRSPVSSARMSADTSSSHSSQVGNQVINASVLVKFTIQE
jgi:uncharacterized protein YggE